MCVRGGLQSKLYTVFSNLLYIKLSLHVYTIQVSSGVAREGGTGWTFPQTRKICKGWGTARASASSEPREQQKYQIFVNFIKILLKFSKIFKLFLKTFKIVNKIVEISSNIYNFFSKHSNISNLF